MNSIRKIIVLWTLAGLPFFFGSAHADERIWFDDPNNGEVFYINPGQSSTIVWVNIQFVTQGYPFIDWKTKVKVDNGAWIENVVSFWTDPLSAGTHGLTAELWEYQIAGGWLHTGTHSITIDIVQNYNVTAANSFPNGQLTIDTETFENVPIEGITNPWPAPDQPTRFSLLTTRMWGAIYGYFRTGRAEAQTFD